MRRSLPFLFLLAPLALFAQNGEKAAACFWGIDFELGIPLNWEITQVERQSPAGVGTGEFVPAFTIGTAADANMGGYFPVPDRPIGNQFVMANDDASPCNCDMDTISLATGPIDLTGRTGLALEFRAFHEMTLGAGDAIVETSTNGTDWTFLDTLDAVIGRWQDLFLDLSSFDNAPFFQLRFRWSDGGGWSSGFALDDLCLRERTGTDLSVIDVQLHNIAADPFITAIADLRYNMLPLEQARPLSVSVLVMNRGLSSLDAVSASIAVDLDGASQGSFNSVGTVDLAPGQRDTLVIQTAWAANNTGEVGVQATVTFTGTDDDLTDNTGLATMQITGPGWDDGYGAMAVDDHQIQGSIGSDQAFIAANRFEIVNNGSTARSITAVLGSNSQVGEQVRAILMDANFAFIDTSLSHTLTQDDINAASIGLPIHLPFYTAPELTVGDYFVGLQRLSGSGTVSVATSGNRAIGASAFMEGLTFDIRWVEAVPMVRLHLNDYAVGLVEEPWIQGDAPTIVPNPTEGMTTIGWKSHSGLSVRLSVIDATGRICVEQDLGASPLGVRRMELDTRALSPGAYQVILSSYDGSSAARLLVVR